MSWEDIKVDLVIREASLACPEVVGSNPAPATKNNRLNWENSSGVFLCQGSKTPKVISMVISFSENRSES